MCESSRGGSADNETYHPARPQRLQKNVLPHKVTKRTHDVSCHVSRSIRLAVVTPPQSTHFHMCTCTKLLTHTHTRSKQFRGVSARNPSDCSPQPPQKQVAKRYPCEKQGGREQDKVAQTSCPPNTPAPHTSQTTALRHGHVSISPQGL